MTMTTSHGETPAETTITPDEDGILSIGQAANLLGVRPETLARWDRKGIFPASFRTGGGHRRYFRSEVDRRRGR